MQLNKNSKIFLAGHRGMVGSAILRFFKKRGYKNIFTVSRKKVDLTNQSQTKNYIKKIKPNFVIIAAAKVGGILSNNMFKGDYIYQNLMIQTNLIHSSYLTGVKKLIFLGSSCVYPKYSKQPIKESELLSGKLEETNDAYAIAKISGVKMCESYNKQFNTNYLCLMPTNLYGENDNYDLKTSHFYSALLKKIYLAKKQGKKSVEIWGDGSAKRELLYVDDLAKACEFFLKKKTNHNMINIGSGDEKTIKEYFLFLTKKIGVKLYPKFDKTKPNGTPRKMLDMSIAKKYGWFPTIDLDMGFQLTFEDFLNKHKKKN